MSTVLDKSTSPHLFKPNKCFQKIHGSFEMIPRYLFRLHGPHTAGETSLSEVRAPASGQSQDLFQNSMQHAWKLLYRHLIWDPEHEEGCNLMSWTSSLLVAIQYGLFLNGPNAKGRHSDLRDLFILVLDTSHFEPGTFVRDMELIDAFRSSYPDLGTIEAWRRRPGPRTLYFGEYLTQGTLDVRGRCVETSLQDLINNGIFTLVPEMDETQPCTQWANRVVSLRETFTNDRTSGFDGKEYLRRAIVIAQKCFGGSWTLPMSLYLLAIKSRSRNNTKIINGLRAMFTDNEIKEGVRSLKITYVNSMPLPEVMQVKSFADDLCMDSQDLEQSILSSFGDLSIGQIRS